MLTSCHIYIGLITRDYMAINSFFKVIQKVISEIMLPVDNATDNACFYTGQLSKTQVDLSLAQQKIQCKHSKKGVISYFAQQTSNYRYYVVQMEHETTVMKRICIGNFKQILCKFQAKKNQP